MADSTLTSAAEPPPRPSRPETSLTEQAATALRRLILLNLLAPGETIQSTTVVASSSGLTMVGGPGVAGTKVYQMVGGGTSAQTYTLRCTVLTNLGQKLVLSGSLTVLAS